MFPTSWRDDNLWFRTYKNGCSVKEDGSYNLDDVATSADKIASLIEHERKLVGGDAKKVFLGGFS